MSCSYISKSVIRKVNGRISWFPRETGNWGPAICFRIVGVKIVLFDNGYLGMVRQWQQLFFDKRYSCVALQNPDFIKIAEGHNLYALEHAIAEWIPNLRAS